jgi:hypothetical protein
MIGFAFHDKFSTDPDCHVLAIFVAHCIFVLGPLYKIGETSRAEKRPQIKLGGCSRFSKKFHPCASLSAT